MLLELRVKDLALVAAADVRFGEGLNLLTGETGSGKSLIVDALGLTLGSRASSDQVRHGARRALVESVFAAAGGTLTLTREVGSRGAARVDGRPATPGQLRDVGRRLVGIHGQHEYTQLLDPETQTLLLDAFAGSLELREQVATAHAAWVAASARVEELERMRARGKREQEYLRWQLEELRSASLRPGEEEELAAQRSVARHAARLTELTGRALETLRGDEGVAAAAAGIRSAAELDARLEEVAGRLGVIEEELADATAEVRRYWEGIDADPRRLEAIEERLALLEGIKRKYGGSIEAAIADRDRLEAQLGVGEDLEGAIANAGEDASRARTRLEKEAAALSRARQAGAERLARAVRAELGGLKLEGAGFEVRLQLRQAITAEGAEGAEMMFSANPGEPLAPLARVASGGELARVMLAIRAVGAEAERLPTLIFDEVDAGIGGEAALQVGLRLKGLGEGRQVLVVTHLAQIACFADHHLVVEKAPGPNGRNLVRVRELTSTTERAVELARMMSGGVTEKALARAHELLEDAGAR
jgi:DNA repair protein RecN (Recombination protein N)